MRNKNILILFLFVFILFLSLGNSFANDVSLNYTLSLDSNSSSCHSIPIHESTLSVNNLDSNITGSNLSLASDVNDNQEDILTDEENSLFITYVTPSAVFSDNISVEIICNNPNATIYYTLDESDPINSTTRFTYLQPFILNDSTTVHYTAIDNSGNYAKANFTWVGISLIKSFFKYETRYYDFVVTYLKKSDIIAYDAIWSKYQQNNGVSKYDGPLTNITSWYNENIVSSGSAVIDKNEHIYVAGEDGYLYCINTQGLIIWRYGTSSKIISTPTIGIDGNIYFSNWMNSTLYCISPDGQLLWKYNLGNYNTGSNIVFGVDGTLYVLTLNNNTSNLFAFRNYELMWNCSLPAISGSTPAIGSDGTIYLLTMEHGLVAVNWDGTIKYSFENKTEIKLEKNKILEMHIIQFLVHQHYIKMCCMLQNRII